MIPNWPMSFLQLKTKIKCVNQSFDNNNLIQAVTKFVRTVTLFKGRITRLFKVFLMKSILLLSTYYTRVKKDRRFRKKRLIKSHGIQAIILSTPRILENYWRQSRLYWGVSL